MLRIAAILATLLVTACTGQRLLPAPPPDVYETAQIPGVPGVRNWGDEGIAANQGDLQKFRRQFAERIAAEGKPPNNGVVDVLVLSGGGADGAFGAGLLNGWSDSDKSDRPEFMLVTGISTGALIAPYAFLGREFDKDLERFYTNTTTDDLLIISLLDALTGSLLGLADTTPLVSTLDGVLTEEFVAQIAAEHNKGRRLLVGTTNLDAQRPVVWNIGEIAATGGDKAIRLIRDILLASSAIPGVFPPIQFIVEADGEYYSEMHADGGVTRQLFTFPKDFSVDDTGLEQVANLRLGTIYMIRNTKLNPVYDPIDAGLLPIASRSVSTLLKFAGAADVDVATKQAIEEGFEVKVAAVPACFDVPETELFDPVYMRELFKLGYAQGNGSKPWTTGEGLEC